MIKFKTLKTSNIILLVFGLVLVSALIAKDLNSKKREKIDSKNAVYKTLGINNSQPVNHIFLDGFRDGIIYQINQGNELKIDFINNEFCNDSCVYRFSFDTLFVNVSNTEVSSKSFDVPMVKITIPELKSVHVNNVNCNLLKFESDTLQLNMTSDYYEINLKNCNLNTLIFNGKSSSLDLDATNTIEHLIFNSKGYGAKLNLDGANINHLDLNSDSAEVNLSGSSIKKYIK